MNYLLDTHVLLWISTDSPQLSSNIRHILTNTNHSFFLSVASLWEMAIKSSLSKLNLGMPLDSFVEKAVIKNSIHLLPIKTEHLALLEKLPFHHKDPFDRLIAAQVIAEKYSLITSDEIFSAYGIDRTV